ncbi:serine/threonine kinase with pentapeptide repeats [Microcystis aeruginosa NIES-3787]|uniref:Serine/threonine kinase with pentapeptide repeats n=2 Tax=Microcystis aeruginosa TaxID=1126 RepID=A0A6H9GIN1_MICAE|nr:serine/threonine kinase with pentapeptide repeats [Microcystis aeruginosa NIES-3787]
MLFWLLDLDEFMINMRSRYKLFSVVLLSAVQVAGVIAAGLFSPVNASITPTLAHKSTKQNQLAQDFAEPLREGNRLFDLGKYGEAIKAYTLVIDDFRQTSEIRIQAQLQRSRAYILAAVFGSTGYDNYDQAIGAAIADCSRVINVAPENSAGYVCRGFAYSYIFSHKEAFADFNRAIELAPNNPYVYFSRGEAYSRSDQFDSAIADFSQAIKLDPKFAEAYYFRGLMYTDKKPADAQRANTDFSQAIQIDSTQVRYYGARGASRYSTGEYQGAVSDYTQVIQRSPSATAYVDRGSALAALGKDAEAMADYNQAILLVPEHIMAYYGRGLLLAKRGDTKGAMSDLQQARRLYQELMGKENFHQPEYQKIIKAIEQLQVNRP